MVGRVVQMMQKYCKRFSFLHKAYKMKEKTPCHDRADNQKMILKKKKKIEHDGVIHQSNTLHNFIIPPK